MNYHHYEKDTYSIDYLPFPICLIEPTGKLLRSNQSGEDLYKNLPSGNFSKLLEILKNKLDTEKIVMINNQEYLLKAMQINEKNNIKIIFITFIVLNNFKNLFKDELNNYQSTIDDLKTIFENSYDVLFVTDGNGITLKASSASEILWGKKPEELIGRSIYKLEEEGIFSPSATRKSLELKKKVNVVQNTITGHRLMVVSTPIKNIHGKIIRVVNASKDITEISVLEEEVNQMKRLISGYRKQLSKDPINNLNKLIYKSKKMSDIASVLPKISPVDSTILVTGETGVGKEVFVNYIHQFSLRKDNPFIKINCASIPEHLLESELFGYEKGSFTGANKNGKAGLFELADKGTLFLDEIGDMPLELQTKLLRVLQENEIMRIGGKETIKIDVRIIAATNQCLNSKISEGLFRKDLYYRLNVIPISIPALRERKEDILPLIEHFLSIYSDKFDTIKTLSKEALNMLYKYSWPGNVRELQNVIERSVVLSNEEYIDTSVISDYIKNSIEEDKNVTNGKYLIEQKNFVDEIQINKIIPLKNAVEQLEKNLIQQTAQNSSNLNEIAGILQVNQSTISRKMHKYKITFER